MYFFPWMYSKCLKQYTFIRSMYLIYIKQIQMKWTVQYFQISIAQSPQLPTEKWEEMGREDSVRYMWVWINLTLG